MKLAAVLLVALAAAAGARSEDPYDAASKAVPEFYAPAPGYTEGPTWLNGSVYFCSGGLLRISPERKVTKYLDIGPAGTYLLADGRMLIADNRHHALLELSPDGKVAVLADSFEGKPLRILNDLTVDAAGNVYWTDPNSGDPKKPDGNVFRLTPDGRVDKIAGERSYPNGIEVDPAGKFLYLIESASKKVLRYDLPAADKPLGEPTLFYTTKTGADGCAFDAAGNFWCTDFGAGEIICVSPAGKLLATVKVPAKMVSNICFGGEKRDTLFATTGGPDGVFRIPVGIEGFKLHPGARYKVLRCLDVTAKDEPLPEKPAKKK